MCVFFKRVVFAVLAVSVIFSALMKRVCRVLIFMVILNGISGAQLLWSVFISTKQILSYIYFFDYECSLPGMVPYHRPGRKGTLASDLKGAGARAPLPCARHCLRVMRIAQQMLDYILIQSHLEATCFVAH